MEYVLAGLANTVIPRTGFSKGTGDILADVVERRPLTCLLALVFAQCF